MTIIIKNNVNTMTYMQKMNQYSPGRPVIFIFNVIPEGYFEVSGLKPDLEQKRLINFLVILL